MPFDPTPEYESDQVHVNQILTWDCYDPDGDDLTYDVWLETSSGGSVLIGDDLTDKSCDTGGMELDVTYYWHVIAFDPDGGSATGDIWSFTTGESFSPDPPSDPDPDEMIRLDHVYARFDSLHASDGPLVPKQPAAVIYNVGGDVPLWWEDADSRYYRDNPHNGWFLAPGNDYTFTVTEGDDVPALTKTIYYPECGPYLNSPDAFSFVSKDGFEVTWSGHDLYSDCPAEVRVRIYDLGPMEWTDFDRFVPNTGSYTFTTAGFSVLDPMTYQIQVVLIIENKEYIDAPGYDPSSWVWARTHSTLFLYLQ